MSLPMLHYGHLNVPQWQRTLRGFAVIAMAAPFVYLVVWLVIVSQTTLVCMGHDSGCTYYDRCYGTAWTPGWCQVFFSPAERVDRYLRPSFWSYEGPGV